MNDLDKDISRMKAGQLAGATREAVEAELDERDKQIDLKAFRILGTSGEILDPQMALQLWIEKHAIFKLRKALLQKEREGQSAAKRLERPMAL